MLAYLTLIFACQLAGEFLVSALGIPIPGPVVGMAMLFGGLLLKGSLPDDLGKMADVLISHLSLLFVPAGVGVLLHARLIGSDLVPISVSLVVSTLLTIAVTGKLMEFLERREDAAGGTNAGGPGS